MKTKEEEEKQWEKEFLSKFGATYNVYIGAAGAEQATQQSSYMARYKNGEMIDFISNLLSQQKSELIKKFEEIIGKDEEKDFKDMFVKVVSNPNDLRECRNQLRQEQRLKLAELKEKV